MPAERAEQARAAMMELFPEGFEERELDTVVELAAYTDAEGEARAEAVFGTVSTVDVAADWGERWREFHRGVRVGSLWVGPPWEAPPEHALPVVIEPGRAFGTGAHPTTRLCLQLLLDLPRGSLLDIGCGSGVLAVAAATLGFLPVLAVDHDPAAVEATAANARRNGVQITVAELDALEADLPYADTTVANLTLAAVCSLLPRVASLHVVSSGYLASDRFAIAGRTSSRRVEVEGWAADLWTPVEE